MNADERPGTPSDVLVLSVVPSRITHHASSSAPDRAVAAVHHVVAEAVEIVVGLLADSRLQPRAHLRGAAEARDDGPAIDVRIVRVPDRDSVRALIVEAEALLQNRLRIAA